MSRFLFSLLLALVLRELSGQNDLEQYLNQIQNQEATEQAAEDLLLQWEGLKSEGLLINRASRQDLLNTGLFTIFQVHNLVAYQERFGNILGPSELLFIKGFSPVVVSALRPYLNFRSDRAFEWSLKYLLSRPRHKLNWRWQANELFDSIHTHQNYLGDPLESRLRYEFRSSSGLSFRYNGQKDPGETWKGVFDHHSMHLKYRGNGNLKELIIGDYQVNFGQGLSLWSGSNFQAPGLGASFVQFGNGPQAYAGNDEQRFFRGISGRYDFGKIEGYGFYSYRLLDARETDLGLKVSNGGYARTEEERHRKNRLPLSSYGFSLAYKGGTFDLQLIHHQHHLKGGINSENRTWQNLRLETSNYRQTSLHIQYLWEGFFLVSECALDQNLKSAGFFSWQKTWRDKFRLQQHLRYHQPEYLVWWAAPPGGNPRGGERGLRNQISAKWNYKHSTLLGLDVALFPWPRHLYSGASAERQIYLLHQWRINAFQKLDIRIMEKRNRGYKSQSDSEWSSFSESALSFRLVWEMSPDQNWKLRSVYQGGWKNGKKESASMIACALQYQKRAWTINWGLSMANTNSDLPRLYDYEPDLLYGFGLVAYYRNTLRSFCRIRYQSNIWRLEAKIGLSRGEAQKMRLNALKFQAQIVF